MQEFKKLLVILAIVVGLILIAFNDNIRGYYRFKAICEKEGGLRVYQKLEPGVGWTAEDKVHAKSVATLKGVGFVRYIDSDGVTYDIRYLNGHSGDDTSFEKRPADLSKPVLYAWKYVNEDIQGELRLSRSGYEVREFHSIKQGNSVIPPFLNEVRSRGLRC